LHCLYRHQKSSVVGNKESKLRVCIIGAGFFGLHIARKIEQRYSTAKVTIIDACKDIFSGAAGNNQCRLHLGFHYPRSGPTIYQALTGFERFNAEYGAACHPIANNLYLIHRDGYVSAEQYLAVMDAFHLKYREVEVPNFVCDKNKIECALATEEMYVNLGELKAQVLDGCDARIILGEEVISIDAEKGLVLAGDNFSETFDFVINATYTSLNMGLSKKPFKVTYEMACLVHARTNFKEDCAVTVMDGPFVSVYPASNNTHTLSSVRETPFYKTSNYDDLRNYLITARYRDEAQKLISKIEQNSHMKPEN
jgi:hypothetical protein